MPRLLTRDRPVLAFLTLLLLALLTAVALVPTVGSGVVRGEGEVSEVATASEPEETQPPEEPCPPAFGSWGPLPAGSLSLSGRVTDAAGIVGPLAGIEVQIRESTGGAQTGGAQSVWTDATGYFEKDGLGDGTYSLAFFDAGASYQGGFLAATGLVPVPGDALPIVLAGSSVADLDAALPAELWQTISGTVTDDSRAPVAGAPVQATSTWFGFVCRASTQANGTYEITVRRGAFVVGVQHPTVSPLRGFYSSLAPGGFVLSLSEATFVTADVSAAVNIDMQFPPTYTLSGTILDALSEPVSGVSVGACPVPGGECTWASSGTNGEYQLTDLPEGSYVVHVGGGAYVYGYYGPGGFQLDRADATEVELVTDVTGIDLLAVLAPSVSGTVTDAGGIGIDGLRVYLEDVVNGGGWAYTAAGGNYTIDALQPGSYVVRVSDTASLPTIPTGYLGAGGSVVADPADAVPVTVDLDGLVGLDIVMPDGGFVTASMVMGGEPAPYAYMHVCIEEWSCVAEGYADDFGNLTLPLLPGSYWVATYLADARVWYVDGQTAVEDFASASEVTVTAGATTSITFTLPLPGAPTPECAGVECEPVPLDDGSGTNPVTLTFDNVTGGGTTTLTVPAEAPAVPAGFSYGDPPAYFEITTTATFAGDIEVCATFDASAFADPFGVLLMHWDGAAWIDITTSVTVVDNLGTVCGLTDSFSPFALVERVYSFGGFFGIKAPPQINDRKAGDPIGVQFSMGEDIGLDILATGTPTWQQVDCVSGAGIGGPQAASTNTGLKYNANTGRYTYEWLTSKAWRKACVALTLTFRDGSTAEALFRFK